MNKSESSPSDKLAPATEQCSICLDGPPYNKCPGQDSCAKLGHVRRGCKELYDENQSLGRELLAHSAASSSEPTEAMVEAAAKKMAETWTVEPHGLNYPSWMGTARAILKSALEVAPSSSASSVVTDAMVDRFLSWVLPESVCADRCATKAGYTNRTGTTLLTADEARQMLEHVLMPWLEDCGGTGNRFLWSKSVPSSEQPTSAAAGSTKAAQGEDSHREGLATASHASTRISGIGIIKLLREQRDELAEVLREAMPWLPGHHGVPAQKTYERARLILNRVPTYEQQLRNVAAGIGMDYEELCAAIAAHSATRRSE